MDQPAYAKRYRTASCSRTDGVLEIRIHSEDGPALWGSTEEGLHNELGLLFGDVARDPANKVVILTGTGDRFLTAFDPPDLSLDADMASRWARLGREGAVLLENLVAIPVPVIGAVNGPATIHAELPLLSDIVLAADTAVFADIAHVPAGLVPGDGVQTVWPLLLGPNRGRYFLLTGQHIGAEEALRLGVVGEVLSPADLMPRARALAETLAAHPMTMLRHTRTVLTRRLRHALRDELDLGLALEGAAYLQRWPTGR